MIKLLILIFWWPHKLRDAEFNIEGMTVKAVERDNARESIISYQAADNEWVDYRLPCTLEKHNDLVARLRKKINATKSIHNKLTGGS